MSVKQISVFLENRSGRLYELADLLGKNGINMIALTVAETEDYGVVRVIADNTEKAVKVLKDNGFTVSEAEVIAVVVPDKPGGLASVLKILKEKDMNIEYLYCFSGLLPQTAVDVMKVEDIELAENALRSAGFQILSDADLRK